MLDREPLESARKHVAESDRLAGPDQGRNTSQAQMREIRAALRCVIQEISELREALNTHSHEWEPPSRYA